MTIGAFIILGMALIMGLGIITTYSPVANQEAYLGNAPQIEIAGILFGPTGRALAGLASFAATFGSVMIAYAAIPRILYAMSREGLWPEAFSWTHPRFNTPWPAIAATGVIFTLPILLSNQVVALINAAAAVWLLVYVWVLLLVIKLRFTHSNADRPFSMNIGVYLLGLGLIFLVLWKAFQGAYHLLGIALVIFMVGFVYAQGWVSFTRPDRAVSGQELSDD